MSLYKRLQRAGWRLPAADLRVQSGHDEVEMCVVVFARVVSRCCASQTG